MGIRTLISYEGTTAQELADEFRGAVEDYLTFCEAEGKEPERAYKGSFHVRISPELHRQAVIFAVNHGVSLNSFVESALRTSVESALRTSVESALRTSLADP